MVTRKPVPNETSLDTNAAVPRVEDMRKELWSATDSPSDVDSVWDDAPQQRGAAALNQQSIPQDVPESLKPGGVTAQAPEMTNGVWNDVDGHQPQIASETRSESNEIPLVLRPGAPPSRSDTNPFKRKEVRDDSNPTSPPTNGTPTMPPAQPLSQMSTGEISNNPWQPALDQHAQRAAAASAQQSLRTQNSGESERDAWAATQEPKLPAISTSPALLSLPSEPTSPAWDDLPENQSKKLLELPVASIPNDAVADQNAWDDEGGQNKGKGKAPAPASVIPPPTVEDGPMDDWNLIDVEPPAGPPPGRSQMPNQTHDRPDQVSDDKVAPALPPRNDDEEQPPRQPPRPVDGKAETYQIKNVRWHDHSADQNPRVSPILVQNANGPCPLLALVNALTLTTPSSLSETALIEVLRSREQISLGYLLDAVVDELMRRTQEALPDVSQLYAFLKGLHTGMNVNPRFVPTPEIIKAFKRTSLTHLHPTERDDLIPGTFEDTREMALYAAFAIPLIHGWLPTKNDPAYPAFERQAASFEDVQTLLFRDEELQERLGELTEEEELVYSDIQSIKAFLETSATQLTPSGLEVITKAMKPGSFAILFRNDHFSTLYRHPATQQLLVLVTDAGYATHDEIVWESLADVNGERTEYYSGDFRIVGGEQPQGNSRGQPTSRNNAHNRPRIDTSSANEGGWTTVPGRGRNKHLEAPAQGDEMPLSPNHEQEDRDLALALQLQEEEEQRHRAEQSARRRESQLSEQYIEQQARLQQGPTTRRAADRQAARTGTGARSNSNGNSTASRGSRRNSSTNVSSAAVPPTSGRQPGQPPQLVRPLVPPTVPARRQGVNRPADEGMDDAPPTYEQAQAAAKYEPPPGHPHHHASSPVNRQGNGGAGPSFPLSPSRPGMGGGRGRVLGPGGVVGSSQGGRERDCIVM
ncbi:hypothetical protein CABS01_03897 [Colletotrichum abscissum]|uniref:MINDY deubiquitinase domain-containing protein n=1 Tax=Colletotrichum abscissum TaxID=1671311 RepID=A0A9P9XHC8_9PEZI|nr:uncharacterized protein CABS01_03897 [Colletotrichum abscissum]KAI3553779.1 hypothetical protein CABS02_06112 [Colletotrichum abscissum]KAK1475620.1 hypothetical protein CABS01_03897 [Colletotrichum abscissum]